MKMNFNKFIPITKTDDEKHMVYGWASTPSLDSQGEIVRVDAIKNSLPDYMKFPTIRDMHQPNAVGVTKETSIDAEKGLFIGAKIVDPLAWEKIKEGVFRGFSIGGNVINRIDNVITDIALKEISLVDRPANSEAIITVFKSDDPKIILSKVLDTDVEAADLNNAMIILGMASELAFIRRLRENEGKKNTQVNRAITALKQLAEDVLSGKDRKKFDQILSVSKKVRATEFAIPSKRELPLDTNLNIKFSMINFLKFKFEDKDEKKEAVRRILKAAKTFDVDTVEFNKVAVMSDLERRNRSLLKTYAPTRLSNSQGKAIQTLKEFGEVVNQMSKKSKKVEETAEKVEDTKVETEVKETEDTATVVDEAKQVSDQPSDLLKEDDVLNRLESLEKSMTETKEEVEITKLDNLTQSVVKVASVLEKLNERISVLEAQPAQPKTLASYAVSKVDEIIDNGDTSVIKSDLSRVDKRLGELTKIAKNDQFKYQQDGLENEAYELLAEKKRLMSKV